MPLHWRADPDGRIAWLVASAPIPELKELQDALARRGADADLRARPRVLCDAREVPLPTVDYVRTTVTVFLEAAHVAGVERLALVVGGEAAYGMGRMAEVLVEEVLPLRTFYTTDDARAWLLG